MKAICIFYLCLLLFPSYILGQCDRANMIEEYETHYLGTNLSTLDLDWTGDTDACKAGAISPMAMNRMMSRLNYFRRLAHVSSDIHLDSNLTTMCQEAALMMHSNNELSHDPTKDWSCYTDDGKKAASKSNLALGAHSVNALSLYMRDPGANNGAVGHRRWILYSRAKDIGLGSTSRAHAMYVIHNRQDPPEDLDYITYPSEGYFPLPLLPERWSFSKPRAKFAGATVGMRNAEGKSVPLTVLEIKNGFGDNTIVWEPDQEMIDRSAPYDQNFEISIMDVGLGDSLVNYSYTVTLTPVVHPPECQPGLSWKEADCACIKSQTTALASENKLSLEVYPNPASDVLFISQEEDDWKPTATATLYDIYGRKIQRWNRHSLKAGLPVQTLANGMYVLKIEAGEWTASLRIQILH